MMVGSCPKQNPSRLRRSYSLMLSHSHHHQSFHVNKLCTRSPLPSPFCEAAISVVIHSSGNQIVPRLQPRTRVLFLTESGDKAVLRLWTHSLFSVCRGKALAAQTPLSLRRVGLEEGAASLLLVSKDGGLILSVTLHTSSHLMYTGLRNSDSLQTPHISGEV